MIKELLDKGLIQFGLFDSKPFDLSLEMICSYPSLRGRLANQLCEEMNPEVIDHLVCSIESICLATTISGQINRSLIPSFASRPQLVGSFDYAHPAMLIVNTWWGNAEQHEFIAYCDNAGLHITEICGVIATTQKAPENIILKTLFKLSDVIDFAADTGYISSNLAAMCKQHINILD